ncbi:MAG: MgtC/SapB family protein [Methanosarcinaceae archaeon]|nr:MgtC/SapB family protein [Methanosarcinaceae archaeon]
MGLSFLIGILIGIEREHRRVNKKISTGVRTFVLACIIGMIATFVSGLIGIEILFITAIFFAALSTIIAYTTNIVYGKAGITNSIALFSTFLLGILVAKDFHLFAIVGAVVVTFILVEKKPLHTFAQHLSDHDILNAVQFLAVAFILYPIMPDDTFFGAVNPRSVILIVVLVSLVSFSSYIFLKKFGTRGGISYSGLLGGFVNSEATTGALSSMSKNISTLTDATYVGILLTNIAMLVRNLIIALIVDPSGRFALLMLPPQLIIIIASLFITLLKRKAFDTTNEQLKIDSPFALGPAFKFGAGFTIILIVATIVNDIAGPIGIYAIALGGLVSSAAVTVSMASLAVNGSISITTAAQAAVLASIISTSAKIALVKISGSDELFIRLRNTFTILVLIGMLALAGWSYYMNQGIF